MAIFETIAIESVNLDSLIPAEVLTVGKALAALLTFTNGEADRAAFKCDGATWTALRRAAAKVTNEPKDKQREVKQYRIGTKGAWKPLAKDASAPKNAATRTVTQSYYSTDAVNRGIVNLRERGIDISKAAERVTVGDVQCVVAVLTKVTNS